MSKREHYTITSIGLVGIALTGYATDGLTGLMTLVGLYLFFYSIVRATR